MTFDRINSGFQCKVEFLVLSHTAGQVASLELFWLGSSK